MKKKILFAAFFFLMGAAVAGEPTPKVLAAFRQSFQRAEKVDWRTSGSTYLAYFTLNGISYNLAYNNKGRLVSSIRRYGENYLPLAVRLNIQERFSGLTIYGVAEVTANNETVYEVYLQNAESLWTVRANHYGDVAAAAAYKKP